MIVCWLLLALALLAAANVTADLLVEHPEAVGEEVADVGQVEEGEGDADQGVDDGDQAAPGRLGCHVPVTCNDSNGRTVLAWGMGQSHINSYLVMCY